MTERNGEGISSLYIHLYFDEDVSAGIVDWGYHRQTPQRCGSSGKTSLPA